MNEYYAKHQASRVRDGIADTMGPQTYADKDDPVKVLYCGSSLQRFQYYAPSVCLAYLEAFACHSVTFPEAT